MSPRSHGSGTWTQEQFRRFGSGTLIEPGVLVFHPENIELGEDVYVGHQAILKAYYKNRMRIGSRSWIGQGCFFHSAGGLDIGERVGIGPHVRILTSTHRDPGVPHPIMDGAIEFAPVVIGDGTDIGVGAIILPGVTVGRGVQIGAGAVVTTDLPDFSVVAGVPARVLRYRSPADQEDSR